MRLVFLCCVAMMLLLFAGRASAMSQNAETSETQNAAIEVKSEPETSSEPESTSESETPEVSLTIGQAVVLGLVEGATEFLPVSSTGHLVIVQDVMGLRGSVQREKAADSLTICIQGGAILAVLLLYWNRVVQILNGLIGRDRSGRRLLQNLLIAFFPAAVLGLIAGDEIKERLYDVRVIAAALMTGGILILIESMRSTPSQANVGGEMNDMTAAQALIVGVMQCVAFWPGFSRSYATILGCRIVKLRMSAAVEFSFLLGLATLTAATGYEGLKHGPEMIELYGVLTPAIALFVAFVAAALSVKFMVASLTRFGLAPFGYYRIILAILCLWWMNR